MVLKLYLQIGFLVLSIFFALRNFVGLFKADNFSSATKLPAVLIFNNNISGSKWVNPTAGFASSAITTFQVKTQ